MLGRIVLAALPAMACTAAVSAAMVANSATVVPGSLTQGTVKASMSGNAYARETNNMSDWPLTTGGNWAVSLTNCDFSSSTIIAFGDGGGITLKFDHAIHPVANEKEFGIFTAQMVNAGTGGFVNGNMEAAVLVSGDNANWFSLAGQAIADPLHYTATSYKLNAPTHAYDYGTTAIAWSYGTTGAPAGGLGALTVADYQTPMPNDNLFNGTGTNADRMALKTDATTATYDVTWGSSGGGNWFDISSCGLSEVSYVRLNGVNCGGSAGGVRLDAIFTTQTAVPEPSVAGLMLIGTSVLGLRRRNKKVTR